MFVTEEWFSDIYGKIKVKDPLASDLYTAGNMSFNLNQDLFLKLAKLFWLAVEIKIKAPHSKITLLNIVYTFISCI